MDINFTRIVVILYLVLINKREVIESFQDFGFGLG